MENKLIEANDILKDFINEYYREGAWQHTDFVLEDRFFDEIKSDIDDGDIDIKDMTAHDIFEYAIGRITKLIE